MKQYRKTNIWSAACFSAALLASLYVAACRPQTQASTPVPPAEMAGQVLPPASPSAPPTPGPGGTPSKFTFRVVRTEEGAHLERVPVPLKGSPEQTAVALLNEMASETNSPLPQGTRALNVAFEGEGLAVANFNRALKDNFPGGDENESLMLNAILATIGQFKGVQRVQILVEGERVPIGGLQDTTEPLDVPPAEDVRTVAHGNNE